MLRIDTLTCNNQSNPLGIGSTPPRFGWVIRADEQNIEQTEYALQLSESPSFEGKSLWEADIESDASIQVRYHGAPLRAGTKYYWRVRISDNRGETSKWSETAFFTTGLWEEADWHGARFISAEGPDEDDALDGRYLRTEFTADQPIESANLYATAEGFYEFYLNGERVSDALFTPGWTDYPKRLQTQAYDVTALVREGGNALGAHVGPGWYKSGMAVWNNMKRNCYGTRTSVLARLVIRYADGSTRDIVTDDGWRCHKGPVSYSEIYHGETYDAREENPGWATAGFDASGWYAASPVYVRFDRLVPQDGVFVKRHETIRPIELITTPAGETVLDFGQNLVGFIRLTVNANAGDRIAYTHAEVLDSAGNFYTENLRKAKQRISYTCRGGEAETYEPYFTFMGFRYIRVEEFPGAVDLACFEAVVTHSQMKETASFTSSDELLNKLYSNIRWGMKGNFVDVPTDCPQRDERLGWTGDAQIFARTACTLMDSNAFFTKWLRDLTCNQAEDGSVPHVVPDVLSRRMENNWLLNKQEGGACGWADAAVIVPWTLYQCYGDRSILEGQYPSMKAWVEYIRAHSEKGLLWNHGFHFGDWLALDAKEGSYFGATPNDLVATAYYAYSTELLAKTAEVLGNSADAKEYTRLHEAIVRAFRDEFYTPSGRLAANTQTAYALSLLYNLVAPQHRARTVRDFKALIEKDGHLTTGFLGTPALCRALSENGELETAYSLLLKREYPSWIYPVTMGATTIWEHWDGIKPDGSMWSADMNSFNHYAYGAIAQWMFTDVAGLDIDPEKPAYKHAIIAPKPGGGLTHVCGKIDTPYGELSCEWTHSDGHLTVKLTIPHNTTARVTLPGITTGTYGHTYFIGDNGTASTEVGSGTYEFRYPYSLG